ncbi:MAG: NUDIX domain-containing protein [Patescibacteria group bacterium]
MKKSKIQYVLGFVFDASLQQVLLIHKNRPDWQKGRVNGLGGKIEKDETPLQAMSRELAEESNLLVAQDAWMTVGEMSFMGGEVFVFTVQYKGELKDAATVTDEVVRWYPKDLLPENINTNLNWLVPLCINKIKEGKPKHIAVIY